jgi:hypothetical protein
MLRSGFSPIAASVRHWRLEPHVIRHLHSDGLTMIGPLLDLRRVQHDDDALAVAVTCLRGARIDAFLEDEKRLCIEQQGSAGWRRPDRRRIHTRVLLFDTDFDELAARGRTVRVVPAKHGDVAALHVPRMKVLDDVDGAKCDEDAGPADRRRRQCARRRVADDAHVSVLERLGR